MKFNFEAILLYLIIIDCLIYNGLAWFDGKWYKKNFRVMSRHLPITKAFGVFYALLVLWVGLALFRLNII